MFTIRREGIMVGQLAYAEDAAMVIAGSGRGQITYGRTILWDEGKEDQPAGESYDHVAEVCMARMKAAVDALRNRTRPAPKPRCPDCGKKNESKGHQDCPYPAN